MKPNSEILRMGFIGGSLESAVGRAHFAAINLDKKFELVSGCFSRSNEKNLATGREYMIANSRVYSNPEDFVNSEELDAIAILTPTNLHFSHISLALNNRAAIVSEKAFTSSVEDANVLAEEIRRNKKFVPIVFNYTGYPMVRELAAMIKRGAIGEIRRINALMPQETFAKYSKDGTVVTPQRWRLQDYEVNTISLDLGTHLHSLIKYLTGATPTKVSGQVRSLGNFKDLADDVTAIVKYDLGFDAHYWFSKIAIGQRNGLRIELFGSEGSMVWVQEAPDQFTLSDKFGEIRTIDRGSPSLLVANEFRYSRFKAGHPSGFIEALANYYVDIARAIASGAPKISPDSNLLGPDDAVEGLKLMNSISFSSDQASHFVEM